MKLDDSELLSLCTSQIQAIEEHGDLADERSDGMDRYLGEPYGDEVEGRSQVRTRETMETVNGIMPSLMRIFAEEDNLVIFQPEGPEDEEQAEQETDVISHVFWNENNGFYNLYTFCFDALLSKTGILKVWPDEYAKVEREEYKGLDDMQLGQLLNEPDVKREVEEYELTEEGHHIVFKTNWKETKICIEPFPPEEFGVSRSARSPYVKDQNFCYARHRKTVAELLADGYSQDFIDEIPSDDDVNNSEQLARRHLSDEQSYNDVHPMLREIWVTECYLRIDRDGDGIPELLKVTLAAGVNASNGKLMDVEEIDAIPLFATPSHILTHKFYGLSIADILKDLEQIQTVLLRQSLDNTYLANNGMTAINTDYANIEDILTKRPGGAVRTKGDMPINAVVGPIPHNPLPQQTMELFERLDERQRRRTGYGDEVGALDVSALAQMNTGVAALAFDMARSKIELIARIIAEIGLKPLFHHIHEMMIKHNYRAKSLKLRGKWTPVNPSDWKTRTNSDVSVGIGKVSRERRIMGHEGILAKQQELIAAGAMGTLLMPHHQYEAYKGWIKAWGFEPSLYIQDPRQLPPPKPKGPDPQQQLMQVQGQAMLMDGQSKMMRAQNEQAKIALEAKAMEVEKGYRQAEMFMKGQVEALKREQAQLKADMEAAGKVIDMQDQLRKERMDRQLRAIEMQLNHVNKARDRDLEYFKLLTNTEPPEMEPMEDEDAKAERESAEQEAAEAAREAEATAKAAAEAQKQMEREMAGQRDAAMIMALQNIAQTVAQMGKSQPEDIEYDAKGLMVRKGNRLIVRDASGRAVRVE